MANPFVHVERHTGDLVRARDVYSRLFDWELDYPRRPAAICRTRSSTSADAPAAA